MDTRERVKEILCRELGLDRVDDHARMEQVPEWDSMAYMSVVAALEEAFDLVATAENIERFGAIDDILGLIAQAGKG